MEERVCKELLKVSKLLQDKLISLRETEKDLLKWHKGVRKDEKHARHQVVEVQLEEGREDQVEEVLDDKVDMAKETNNQEVEAQILERPDNQTIKRQDQDSTVELVEAQELDKSQRQQMVHLLFTNDLEKESQRESNKIIHSIVKIHRHKASPNSPPTTRPRQVRL